MATSSTKAAWRAHKCAYMSPQAYTYIINYRCTCMPEYTLMRASMCTWADEHIGIGNADSARYRNQISEPREETGIIVGLPWGHFIACPDVKLGPVQVLISNQNTSAAGAQEPWLAGECRACSSNQHPLLRKRSFHELLCQPRWFPKRQMSQLIKPTCGPHLSSFQHPCSRPQRESVDISPLRLEGSS